MSGKTGKKLPYIIYMVKQNLTLLCSSLFLFCFLFLFYTVSNHNGIFYYGQRYCLADAYVWFLMPRTYGILVMPFIVIIYTNLTKYDQMPSVLIRLETAGKWVARKVTAAILLSVVAAAIALVVVTVMTSLQVTTILNWDKEQSVYYAMTQCTNEWVQIGQVMLMAFITIFIRNFLVCLVTVLLMMKFHNAILTFMVITFVTVCEMFVKKLLLFHNIVTLDYDLWESPKLVLLYIVYCLAALIFLGVAIRRCSTKREWMR